MAVFSFSFEFLLKYKKEEEKQIVLEIQQKTNQRNLLQEDNLKKEQDNQSMNRLNSSSRFTNYSLTKNFKNQNFKFIEENKIKITEQQKLIDQLQQKLLKKNNEIKALENLKEKQLKVFQKKNQKKQQIFIDDQHLNLKKSS